MFLLVVIISWAFTRHYLHHKGCLKETLTNIYIPNYIEPNTPSIVTDKIQSIFIVTTLCGCVYVMCGCVYMWIL